VSDRWDDMTVPSRLQRSSRGRRRRMALGGVALVALIGLAAWLLRPSDAAGPAASGTASATGTATGAPVAPGGLLAMSVTGTDQALVAVVGSTGAQPPAALVLPPGVTVIVPGQGEATLEDVQQLPAPAMQTAVSNAVGVWTQHYLVTDLRGLERAIDGVAPIEVELPDVFTVGNDVFGPGDTPMTGAQAVAFVEAGDADTALRWSLVLEAMLGTSTPISFGGEVESDDAQGAAALLAGATDAVVEVAPVQIVGGSTAIPAQPAFDELVQGLFGVAPPVATVLQNGSGRPGADEAVARLLLPEGFRVVLSQNAETFDHQTTEITATGTEHMADAERARTALGLGVIQVSQVPSGLADVTIVVGKDFDG
jgi:hypothetical protein